GPLPYPVPWTTRALHSTATTSTERAHGLGGLRLVHYSNLFLSCHGHSARQAFFTLERRANPNLRNICSG
ncbi:hypothetical protein B0H13DRAFT_1620088, partial [Mycena leptocephala]